MKYHELLISRTDLTVLGHALGSTWICYGMEAGAQAGAYALECVFVQLDDCSLTIAAELVLVTSTAIERISHGSLFMTAPTERPKRSGPEICSSTMLARLSLASTSHATRSLAPQARSRSSRLRWTPR